MKFTVFDIETGPLPDEQIEKVAPPFDPESVRVGNYGMEKAMEKITQAKESHMRTIKLKAALKAEYGQILAIGWQTDVETFMQIGREESTMLETFWEALEKIRRAGERIVGFNCFNFDLPYLLRRSILLGVEVPHGMLPKHNRYWPDEFIDLMKIWQATNFMEMISLDRFAKALGHSGKNGSGAHFAKTLKEDAVAAAEYTAVQQVLARLEATAPAAERR